MQFTIRPIAFVRSERTDVRDDFWGRGEAVIELADDMPSDSLAGLDAFSHAEVLFVFDRADPVAVTSGARHPRNNPAWPKVGIFAQRAKGRPNRLGTTVVRVLSVSDRRVRVAGLDAVDGTPVVDIKPVMAEFMPTEPVRQPDWSRELMQDYWREEGDRAAGDAGADRAASAAQVIVRVLQPHELSVLDAVAEDVFDGPVDRRWAGAFLSDPRHHLSVAIADGTVVGMASGVDYVHPDKPPELWVNEVGVAGPYQNQGIGRRLLHALFERGRQVGCTTAWVATEPSNTAARSLYRAVGGVEDAEPFVMVSFPLDSPSGVAPAEPM